MLNGFFKAGLFWLEIWEDALFEKDKFSTLGKPEVISVLKIL